MCSSDLFPSHDSSATKRKQQSGAKATVSRKKSGQMLRAPEVKQYDVGLNLTSLDTPGSSTGPSFYHVLTLNNISGGDGQSERSGVKVQCRKLCLRVKLAVDPNSDASNANIVADAHTCRIVVYKDSVSSGGGVTWQQVFDYVPNNDGQLYDYQNVFLKRRFKLLVDELVTIPHSFVAYDGDNFHAYGNNIVREFTIPLSHDIWFGDTTNNYSSIMEGNIGMFICSDASSSTYQKIKFSFRSRLEYMDY